MRISLFTIGLISSSRQHDNGPHQDEMFDKLPAFCLALREQNFDSAAWWTDALNRLFKKGEGLSSL